MAQCTRATCQRVPSAKCKTPTGKHILSLSTRKIPHTRADTMCQVKIASQEIAFVAKSTPLTALDCNTKYVIASAENASETFGLFVNKLVQVHLILVWFATLVARIGTPHSVPAKNKKFRPLRHWRIMALMRRVGRGQGRPLPTCAGQVVWARRKSHALHFPGEGRRGEGVEGGRKFERVSRAPLGARRGLDIRSKLYHSCLEAQHTFRYS